MKQVIRQSKVNRLSEFEHNYWLMSSLESKLQKAVKENDDELFWKCEKELAPLYLYFNKNPKGYDTEVGF